jgi:hypothetical protein
MKRIYTDSPSILNLYRSLHILYDETKDQEVLRLLEAAESCTYRLEQIPFSWFIDGVKVLNNLKLAS